MTPPKKKAPEPVADRGPGPDVAETLVSVQDAPAVEPVVIDDADTDDIDLEED